MSLLDLLPSPCHSLALLPTHVTLWLSFLPMSLSVTLLPTHVTLWLFFLPMSLLDILPTHATLWLSFLPMSLSGSPSYPCHSLALLPTHVTLWLSHSVEREQVRVGLQWLFVEWCLSGLSVKDDPDKRPPLFQLTFTEGISSYFCVPPLPLHNHQTQLRTAPLSRHKAWSPGLF